LTLVSIGVAFLALAVPKGRAWWNLREGTQLVRQLTADVRTSPFLNVENTLVEARDALRQNRPDLLPDAIEKFHLVLATQPRNVPALTGLAEAWVESYATAPNRTAWENAGRLLRYARTLAPDSADVARAEIRQLWKAGRQDEAIARLEGRRDLVETDSSSRILLARMAVEAGDFSKATIHLHEAVRADPGNLTYLLTFADVFERQGKYAEAASYVQKALSVSTSPRDLLPRLANLYRLGNEPDSAEAIYRQLVNTASPREEDLFAFVDLLSSQERLPETIARATDYLDRFPDGPHTDEVRSFRRLALAKSEPAPAPVKAKPPKKRRSRRS
jgi:tetratricopeptide (TPR) repeat protein